MAAAISWALCAGAGAGESWLASAGKETRLPPERVGRCTAGAGDAAGDRDTGAAEAVGCCGAGATGAGGCRGTRADECCAWADDAESDVGRVSR